MSQFDFIVNPTTGKKVKLSSPLGRLILNSYSQVAGGDSFEEERLPTNYEKRLQIHQLLETNFREYFDTEVPEYNYTVFFENDMVKVSPITAYYPDDTPDELKANNSVGTIVDPRKLGINLTDNENIAFKYFHPEDLVDHSEFGKGNFIYTKQSGLQILEFNRVLYSTGNVREALGDDPSNELINYAQEIGDIDIEFNKTTSHPDDVSFYSIHGGIDQNDNEKLYMVNWEKEGEQFLSLMPVSHLRFDRRQDMYTSSDDEEEYTSSDEDEDGDDEPDQSSESDSSSVASDDFSRAIGDIIPDDESIHGSETHSLAGDVSLDRSRDDEIMDHILELPNEPSQLLDQSNEEMPVDTFELDQLLDDASAIINNT